MEITQIQLSYLEHEDRMIIRINMGEDKHVSLLLTRRICRFMFENLNAFLGLAAPVDTALSPLIPSQSDPLSKAKEFQQPLAEMDLSTPFQERNPDGNILPSGKSSELVINAACNRGQESLTFKFFVQDAEPLNLNMPKKLAMGIHQLLSGLAIKAQWFSGLTPIDTSGEPLSDNQPAETKQSIIYH